MESKKMAAVESIGASSEIKEQYENIKSLLGGGFFIPSLILIPIMAYGRGLK